MQVGDHKAAHGESKPSIFKVQKILKILRRGEVFIVYSQFRAVPIEGAGFAVVFSPQNSRLALRCLCFLRSVVRDT
jgi:hypothetical protein